MISIRSPGREGEHSNVKIKALAFVLMAVLLLCGCGQKSETAAATPAQAVTASAAQSSTARPVSTGVTPEQFGAKGDGIADDLRALQAAMQQASAALFPTMSDSCSRRDFGMSAVRGDADSTNR